ncbi:hypothetical protein Pyn_05787 [Prunus yedoensis var. nudiflora]|uniref:PPM-type phosphatase domain-containing protein n=1 Tax=Prunus yedoensis var. nudiflora TaxID=2094558 RepID=A0A314ZHJ4_PRUYE|nr:hypothetical protein Pyn_05787 [Prunus yedoensis var. nudiflora]
MSHSVQSHVRAKSKETMRKAYLGARAKTRESTEETHGVGNAASTRQSKTSDLVVGAERVDPDTEFVILASTGIWEVMKNQEAVNLIKHIENPQAASECLAKEASNRMSRGSISCLVIRFD